MLSRRFVRHTVQRAATALAAGVAGSLVLAACASSYSYNYQHQFSYSHTFSYSYKGSFHHGTPTPTAPVPSAGCSPALVFGSADGTTSTTQSVPTDFPKRVPLPNGASLQQATVSVIDHLQQFVLVYTTSQPVSAAAHAYDEALYAQQFHEIAGMSSGADVVSQVWKSSDWTVAVLCSTASIQITVVPNNFA